MWYLEIADLAAFIKLKLEPLSCRDFRNLSMTSGEQEYAEWRFVEQNSWSLPKMDL